MMKTIINFIDGFLNKITMYKLVLYFLIVLVVVAIILSWFAPILGLGHVLPFGPLELLFSTFLILTICFVVNEIFAWAFNAPTNVESVYITGLILVLIVTPISNPYDTAFLSFAVWASIWAMASKFIFAISRKHIWNPAAFAVALTAMMIGGYASWWVGTLWMAPFVLVGGLLIARKIRRFDLVMSAILGAVVMSILLHVTDMANMGTYLWRLLALSPLLFFVLVMLTEPLTTPPRKWLRILYGAIAGVLVVPSVHFGSIYFTPELALIIANIFSYLVSPKIKLLLTLRKRVTLTPDTYDFQFVTNKKVPFEPGQYLEWTLDRASVDSRGNRRYFTIASSPTEDHISLGVKFYPNPSMFKKNLLDMKDGDTLVASQLSGDFVLPKDRTKKLVFIAGGIGITPFRSMIKYLIDTNEKRDITLLYSNRTLADIAYKDVFDEAGQKLGIKTVYAITDTGVEGFTGFIDANMIAREVRDYEDRHFYISGPHNMVTIFESTLSKLGIKKSHIKTDYFPGFA